MPREQAGHPVRAAIGGACLEPEPGGHQEQCPRQQQQVSLRKQETAVIREKALPGMAGQPHRPSPVP